MPLRLVRYPARSENWYLRGSVRGERIFETTGVHERAAAEAIRITREAQLLNDSLAGRRAAVTFAEAALSYLEQGGEARFLGRFDETRNRWTLLIGHFGTTPVTGIDQAAADDAARELLPGTAAATRKRQLYVPLGAVLNHAARKWRLPVAKLQHPKVRQSETRWATPEWVTHLLPCLAPRYRRLVMVLLYTGARLSEVLRLDWDNDVDLQARTIVFRRTKTKMRTVHMADALLIALAGAPPADRRGPMFPWRSKCAVHRPLRNACKRAGIPYLTPHQLGRHSFATWLRIYGKRDLRGLMEDGGWDSIASVARYAHVVPGESVAAVDLLPSVTPPATEAHSPKDRRIRRRKAA